MKKTITNMIAVFGIAIAAGFGITAPASAKTADQRIDDACRHFEKDHPGSYPRCVRQYRQYFGTDLPDNNNTTR